MTTRSFGDLASAYVGYRNPDRTNVPRRNSYDVSDPRADVWRRICDGSHAQGRAWRAAKLELLEMWIKRHWDEGYAGEHRLRRIDLHVLKALLSFVRYSTGELYPRYEKIAETAGVCRATVAESLKRLKHWKFVDWVRRTVVAETAGEMGPQREQTSNAYHFGCEREMDAWGKDRFRKALDRNLGRIARLGRAVKALKAAVARPLPVPDPATQAAFDRMEAALLARSEVRQRPLESGMSAGLKNRHYPLEGKE